ncbi:hypothetical protein PLESTB_000214900 [Pleodorina starrii]|uniref:Uncharacterized protein n=1 Tax=Pleodorina starrii TaxID=330485 RepID=A0A9W6BC39_9CHLO|nr:hypothetical protein PLESTB_000214900 [Pleodorina starrii]
MLANAGQWVYFGGRGFGSPTELLHGLPYAQCVCWCVVVAAAVSALKHGAAVHGCSQQGAAGAAVPAPNYAEISGPFIHCMCLTSFGGRRRDDVALRVLQNLEEWGFVGLVGIVVVVVVVAVVGGVAVGVIVVGGDGCGGVGGLPSR